MIQPIHPMELHSDPSPGATGVLIVPPFLKHYGGPLAGPAYLKGAGEDRGHVVSVLDLNRKWISERIEAPHASGPIKGDHDKPSAELTRIRLMWLEQCAAHWPGPLEASDHDVRLCRLQASHDEVESCAQSMAEGPFGIWCERQLADIPRPAVVGLSVMFSGQVLGSLAISIVCRRIWPGVPIIWGGAHVTALAENIGSHARYGRWVDGFVAGYAEKTWADLLDALNTGRPWPTEVFAAGRGHRRALEDGTVAPKFELEEYKEGPLTLPVQASRGCAYGKCAFCTYPNIEGKYRKLNLEALRPVVELTARKGATLSFKDSLLVLVQLNDLAKLIAGRVEWSACTKLHDSLDAPTLARLHAAGLRTLEIGLETLQESSQRLIGKRQSHGLFCKFLDGAAAAGVAVVVNYMTGLPGADPMEERQWLEVVKTELAIRNSLIAKIELNTFQLELLSPMGISPSAYGINITRTWPWSSLAEFEIAKMVQRVEST
jgi:hypothetical protein